MCFPSTPSAAVAPAPAPPAPSPLAQAVSPTTGINAETASQTGYNADGTPNLMRDPALATPSGASGIGGATPGAVGVGTM